MKEESDNRFKEIISNIQLTENLQQEFQNNEENNRKKIKKNNFDEKI